MARYRIWWQIIVLSLVFLIQSLELVTMESPTTTASKEGKKRKKLREGERKVD